MAVAGSQIIRRIQVAIAVAGRFDQDNLCARGHSMGPFDVERLLLAPAAVKSWFAPLRVDHLEVLVRSRSYVCRGLNRKTVLRAERIEVVQSIFVVEGIDDHDRTGPVASDSVARAHLGWAPTGEGRWLNRRFPGKDQVVRVSHPRALGQSRIGHLNVAVKERIVALALHRRGRDHARHG